MPREPLLLIPGVLCAEELWRGQTSGLADITLPIVTMEHAAHTTIAAIAEAILAAAPSRFALAGLSLGGYVAFEILRRAHGRVSRLALLDTSALPDRPEQTATRREMIGLARDGRFDEVMRRLLPEFVHPDRASDAGLLARMRADAERVGPAGFIRQQGAAMTRIDSRPTLSAIRVPTLVVVGRQDMRTPPPLAEEIAAGIAGARLVVIENSGHLPSIEQPAATNAALRDWLSAGETIR